MDHKVALQVGISGKARGPQKAKTRDADDISMTNVSGEYVEFKGELFLKLVSGNLLPKAWEDLYIDGLVLMLLLQRSG